MPELIINDQKNPETKRERLHFEAEKSKGLSLYAKITINKSIRNGREFDKIGLTSIHISKDDLDTLIGFLKSIKDSLK